MPTRNAPTAAETLSRSREPGDDQRQPEDDQQQDLVARAEHQPAERLAVPQGHQQHQRHGGERDPDRQRAGQQPPAEQQPGDQRQVGGHGEVLDDQDRQHHRGLAVADPLQLPEDLGDDARGGDVGHPAQHHRGQRRPAEQQPGGQPGGEVQAQVDQAGRGAGAQAGGELARRVLQAQQEQQQDHPDVGADLDELVGGDQRQQAALAEGEPGEQVQGDGGQAEPTGQATEDAEPQDHPAELQQHDRVVHAVSSRAVR